MIIRKLEKEDGELLLKLMLELDTETSFMLYEPGERKSTVAHVSNKIGALNGSGGIVFGVEQNVDLVGFVSAQRGSARGINHSAYIVMGVLRSVSRKGMGSTLLRKIDEWALDNKITKLELTVMVHNERAFELYKRMGYEVEGTKRNSVTINDKTYDEYYMSKVLT